MQKAGIFSVVKIKVRLRVNVPHERIWQIVSDVDNDLYFWRGLTSIKNISRSGNSLRREVMLGSDNICIQAVTVFPTEKIKTRWVRGVISGTREVLLIPLGETTLLEVHMNYEFPNLGSSDSKRLAKLFQNEAEFAVDLIRKISEESHLDDLLPEARSWVN